MVVGLRLWAVAPAAAGVAFLGASRVRETACGDGEPTTKERLLWAFGDVGVFLDAEGRRLCRRRGVLVAAGEEPAEIQAAYQPQSAWRTDWDGRAALQSTRRRTVYLIRHGSYDTRDSNGALTDLGHKQAGILADRLRAIDAAHKGWTKCIVHSNMVRAVQTATHVHNRLPNVELVVNEDLAEGRPCVPIPSKSAERWPEEGLRKDGPRIERAFRSLFYRAGEDVKRDECVIVVCHANVIRYFVCRALQIGPENWLRMSLAHCSITAVCIHPSGRVSLQSFGDHGHLQPHDTTRS